MNTLNATKAHFIRCIVPNYERQPFVIDGPLVLHQLRCNGVLEGIRICRRGYPNRQPFIEFIRRYKIIATCDHFDQQDSREAAVQLCSLIGLKRTQFQIGRTRVFFRVGVVSELESRRKERIAEHIVKFQAWIRWFREQQRVNDLVVEWNATVTVQRNIRDFATAMRWPWYHLWMQVRELIPLERDRKRLQELEERNVELQKLYEMAVGANQRQERQIEDMKQQLREQRSLEKEKTSELREDLKRNEDLLELMERKFDEQHTKIMRLNDALKDNMRSLERMEVEKFELQKSVDTLREKHGSEQALRENLERLMDETKENSRRLEDEVESSSRELRQA
ncbi:Protein HUM-9 [Aphelenchoides avenae]|nr:Protein HUM-9 [Aphelenchus avenae]